MPAYDRTTLLPDVLQAVTVRVRRNDTDLYAPTRVLDLEQHAGADVVVVASPAGAVVGEHHVHAELAWTHPLGRVSCEVSTESDRRAYGSVWVLTPSGPLRRVQERRYFRARMSVPLRLRWEDGAEPTEDSHQQSRDGVTVDLSEGGVLGLLRGDPPAVGSGVEATLRLNGDEMQGRATVVRHVPYPGGVGVGVMFDEPNENADTLRRLAFESERRRVRTPR